MYVSHLGDHLCTDKDKHKRRWHNVDLMLDLRLRHRSNIYPAPGQRLVFAGYGVPIPYTRIYWYNIGLMLFLRLQRWPNIKPTLYQRLMAVHWKKKRVSYDRIAKHRVPQLKTSYQPLGTDRTF